MLIVLRDLRRERSQFLRGIDLHPGRRDVVGGPDGLIADLIPQAAVALVGHQGGDPMAGSKVQARTRGGPAVDAVGRVDVWGGDLAQDPVLGNLRHEGVLGRADRLDPARIDVGLFAHAVPAPVVILFDPAMDDLQHIEQGVAFEGAQLAAAEGRGVPHHQAAGLHPSLEGHRGSADGFEPQLVGQRSQQGCAGQFEEIASREDTGGHQRDIRGTSEGHYKPRMR